MVDLKETAHEIVELLQECGFDDVTDSSGYFIVKEFEDGTDRAVDVYKSTQDCKPHFAVYISFEDENSDFKYTDDLSVESLEKVLKEISSC